MNSLAEVSECKMYKVEELKVEAPLQSLLHSLGILPDSEIILIYKESGINIIKVLDTKYSICDNLARGIIIKEE